MVWLEDGRLRDAQWMNGKIHTDGWMDRRKEVGRWRDRLDARPANRWADR